MPRKAVKVSDKAPTDKPLAPAEKAAATTRTPEQQAIIDRDREALARHDAGLDPVAPAPGASSLAALKAATIGGDPGSIDSPRKDPRPHTGPSSHIINSGDKVDNLATAFHAEQDRAADQREAPMSRRARAMQGLPVSEEDRRRAVMAHELGVDTFPREAGEGRPNEPTLQQCNAQYFREEDAKMARKVELQESVGNVLHEAFGPQGARRTLKNLR